jgi:quercetin dioxygenase-like cupin family protein
MRDAGLRLPCYGALFVALSFAVAVAQDPTKVEPTHYKLAFENAEVQVVDVHYGPHEKSKLHAHPGGVVVVLTGGHLRFTDEHGKSQEVFAKAGEARWFAPFKHQVENLGDTPYNAVYVGIKNQHAGENARLDMAPAEMDEPTRKLVAAALAAATTQ